MKQHGKTALCIAAALLMLATGASAAVYPYNKLYEDALPLAPVPAPFEDTRYFIVTGVEAGTGDALTFDIPIDRESYTGEELVLQIVRDLAESHDQELDSSVPLTVKEISDPLAYGTRFIPMETRYLLDIQDLTEEVLALRQENAELRFENGNLKRELENRSTSNT